MANNGPAVAICWARPTGRIAMATQADVFSTTGNGNGVSRASERAIVSQLTMAHGRLIFYINLHPLRSICPRLFLTYLRMFQAE
jgi:hypothetical protein